jgi:hypothetical protein
MTKLPSKYGRPSVPQSNSLADLRERVKVEHAAVIGSLRKGLEHAFNTGALLGEARRQLRHGEWLPWLKSCGIEERTAQLPQAGEEPGVDRGQSRHNVGFEHHRSPGPDRGAARPEGRRRSPPLRQRQNPLTCARMASRFITGLIREIDIGLLNVIDWKEISDSDTWELFARDFLSEIGFVIEVGPGRGPDARRDLLVSEQLHGIFQPQKRTWLVSCKHFAKSGKSVGVDDETSIIDRVRQHSADGFLDFYSTLPSAGLVERLRQYTTTGELAACEILDGKKIEARFVDTGLSNLALRYIPETYGRMRPIHALLGKRVELKCDMCGADLLERSVLAPFSANLVWSTSTTFPTKYEQLFVVCKGECDRKLQDRLQSQGLMTSWEDVGDLCNPILYLKNILTYTNMLRDNPQQFSEDGHKRMKEIYVCLGQRTLREITEEDRERFELLSRFGIF